MLPTHTIMAAKERTGDITRVVVKEANWLGDVVMSLPALKAVRRAFPQARLAVLIKRELASFFDGMTWIEEVIPYTLATGLRGLGDRRKIVAALRARHFDLAVLFPKSFDAALWPTLARIPYRAGVASDARGWLLTHKTTLAPEILRTHQVHSYLQMLRNTLRVDGDARDYAPEVSESHRGTMRTWLNERRRRPAGGLIALAPAAAYGPAKEWPSASYALLIDVLSDWFGAESVLVGSPNERGKCEAVATASRAGALVAAGETSVGEAMALLSLCDGFAGNDSGSMHVAGALGIPTVGLYGSTRPERTGPLGTKTRVVYHPIECSPCLRRTCRFGHYNCLTQITAEEVLQALEGLGALRDGRV
jgi:heptosyltransferase-2